MLVLNASQDAMLDFPELHPYHEMLTLYASLFQSSSSLNRGTNSGNQVGDVKEGIHQNKVKSMATQLLAKFEENAPNISLRRQVSEGEKV